MCLRACVSITAAIILVTAAARCREARVLEKAGPLTLESMPPLLCAAGVLAVHIRCVAGACLCERIRRDYISMIRAKYPHFRIGIVHVVCDADIIWKRVQERCARTGRCIQRQVVDLSVQMTPKAVEMLTPLTDFVAVVRSDGDLKDDKFKPIVIKHVREELLAAQLEEGHMENCDLDTIRRLRDEQADADGDEYCANLEVDHAHVMEEAGDQGTVGANIDLLERLLAGR